MPTVIQIKRGTASSWTSANTILANGEIGFETDTRKMKVGDGSTAWTSLSYAESIPTQTGNSGKYLTTDGSTASWGSVSGFSAPTLGSTSIASGATVTTIVGLTKIRSDQFTTLDASGYEIDLELMAIMGAF